MSEDWGGVEPVVISDLSRLTEPYVDGIDPAAGLITQIDDTLWQGGWPGYRVNRLPSLFRFVVNIYGKEGYEIEPGVEMIVRRWHDNYVIPLDVEETADWINEARAKGPTLVHCEGGWNRSGLACGLALIKSGMTPDDAIALLRSKRSERVLFNPYFVEYLRGRS